MPLVDTQDGRVISFPDSMSESDIKSALDGLYKPKEPKIALSPYEQLRAAGTSPLNVGATTGPANPAEVLALPQLAQIPGKALEQITGPAGDLLTEFLHNSGLDPSAQPGKPIVDLPDVTAIPGTDIHPLDLISPDVRKGVQEGLKRVAEPFLTPEGVSTIPALSLKPVQALYGLSAAAGLPDQIRQIAESKDPQEAARALTEAGANVAMTGLIGRNLLKGEPYARAKSEAVQVDGGKQARDVGALAEGTPSDVQKPTEVRPVEEKAQEAPTVTETTPQSPETAEGTAAGLRPAIRKIGGDVVVGEAGKTHEDIITENKLSPHDIDQRGFVDEQGNFLDREQAKQKSGLPSRSEEQRLHSTDLPEAKEGQLGGGAAEAGEIPDTGAGGEKYGVAERVREERAKAGQVEPIPPGEGVSPLESVNRGRALLQADPTSAERLMQQFESTKALSPDAMAVARAHGEALAAKARTIEERFGTDSDEYRAARDALTAWDRRSKAMQTSWHESGQAQQGETDLDTGSFTGLQRAFTQQTGKEFTPSQEKVAKGKADKVKQAQEQTQQANTALSTVLDHEFPKTKESPSDAEKAALQAVHTRHQEIGRMLADIERKQRVAKTVAEQERLKIQADAAKKALDAAMKVRRDAATRLAKIENENRIHPERRVWERIKSYMDQGETDLHKMRGKVAVDLGISRDEVTKLMARTKRVNRVADDLVLKQQTLRRAQQAAKRWLMSAEDPLLNKALRAIPSALFKLRVGLHGTVAPGTHAPMLLFDPREWGNLFSNSAKMYKMVGLPTFGGQRAARVFYENQMADLVRDKNWGVARKGGLINDPYQYEDFTSPDTSKFYGDLTGMGNRGYSMLKLLRQDVFNRAWDNLPKTLQTDAMAKQLSDQINHITGVTQKPPFPGSHYVLFAPRLLLSRTAWLGRDPIKALGTILNWKNESPENREFARREITGKLTVAGTMFSMLAANQALLSLFGSKQKVNMTNPNESDFLHFKALDMDASFGSPMISMARLPVRLVAIGMGPKGKMGKIVSPDDQVWTEAGRFVGGQLSPAAQLALQLAVTREDPTGKQLPHSVRPQPKRLRERGIKPYTWGEYVTQQLSPIPFQEMEKEIWGKNFERTDQEIKAWTTLLFMLGTGGRMREDLPKKSTVSPQVMY